MLNFYCVFSILVSRLVIRNSILFLRFWIFFTIIKITIIFTIYHFQLDSLSLPPLFGLACFYHVHLPAEYFSAFSSCLGCCVWGDFSVYWKFVVPLYYGGSSLWVGLDEWLFKLSRLGKHLSVFWWVKLDLFSLECNEVSSSEF